jgi:hypothetical protein
MLVLWGMHSGQGSGYDVLKVRRDHADGVRGLGIESGHFIPEEQPDGVEGVLRRLTRLRFRNPAMRNSRCFKQGGASDLA